MQRDQVTYQRILHWMRVLRHNEDGSWTWHIHRHRRSLPLRNWQRFDPIYGYHLAIRSLFVKWKHIKQNKENKHRKDFQDISQRVIWIAYRIACWNHVRINAVNVIYEMNKSWSHYVKFVPLNHLGSRWTKNRIKKTIKVNNYQINNANNRFSCLATMKAKICSYDMIFSYKMTYSYCISMT